MKLVRTAWTADGREETRLFVNDAAILTASNDGVRLAEYSDEVEQLEAVAAGLPRLPGRNSRVSRVSAAAPGGENGIPVRNLPAEQTLSQEDEFETRRGRLDDHQARGGGELALTIKVFRIVSPLLTLNFSDSWLGNPLTPGRARAIFLRCKCFHGSCLPFHTERVRVDGVSQVTVYEVARKAGVSIATVSRVLEHP